VAVADAYDAMTSDRVYRKSLGQQRAIEILTSEQGKQWDPYLVAAFLRALSTERSDFRTSSEV
jgi:HD-GYP domain-containing protein (c-di-GMP phosphodiesterase class II)